MLFLFHAFGGFFSFNFQDLLRFKMFECLNAWVFNMLKCSICLGFFSLTNLLFLSCCHAIPIDMRHPKIPINLRNVASNSCFKNDFSNCVANVRTYLHEYSIRKHRMFKRKKNIILWVLAFRRYHRKVYLLENVPCNWRILWDVFYFYSFLRILLARLNIDQKC